MNLIDCFVTKVNGEPVQKHGAWFLPVTYDGYGHLSDTELMFSTKEEADKVDVNYEFLA